MVRLNDAQLSELSDLLGHDPAIDGEWSITPTTGPCIYAINSKGTIVVRLSCIDKAGRKQAPRRAYIRAYPDGYLFCNLNNKDIRLHRLMAWTWLDDWDETLTVNHKDGDKLNNCIDNLEMMTVHDNCVYYHTSNQVAEQRTKDYAHHGDTIRGRIHITDGVHAKMIYEADGIPDGWWRGRPQSMKNSISAATKGRTAHNTGKQMITNGVTTQYINVDDSIPEGWVLGGINQFSEHGLEQLRISMTGRIYVHKDNVNKRIYSNQLDEYLAQGWVKGMHTKRRH